MSPIPSPTLKQIRPTRTTRMIRASFCSISRCPSQSAATASPTSQPCANNAHVRPAASDAAVSRLVTAHGPTALPAIQSEL